MALQRGFVLILIVTAVAIAGTVLVARNRLRATLVLLLGAAATFVVVRAVVNKVLDEIPSVAAYSCWAGRARSRHDITGRLAGEGIGPCSPCCSSSARSSCTCSTPTARCAGEWRQGPGSRHFADAIAVYRVPVALLSGGAALLVITIAGFSVLSLIVALLLAVLAMFALWVPDRLGADAPPPEPPAASADGAVS